MNTINVKSATRAEILDYVKELRKTKHVAHSNEDINNQLDYEIRQGLTNEERDNVELRRHQIDCWEQVVKIEREAERRDAEYNQIMIGLQDKLDEYELDRYCDLRRNPQKGRGVV